MSQATIASERLDITLIRSEINMILLPFIYPPVCPGDILSVSRKNTSILSTYAAIMQAESCIILIVLVTFIAVF